jgi:hypothetical protein
LENSKETEQVLVYIELKYPWPIETDHNSIRAFSKSLPTEVLDAMVRDPDFGKPILFDLLIQRYKTALFNYHTNN